MMDDAQKEAMTPLEILRSNKRWFTDVRDYYILYEVLSAREDMLGMPGNETLEIMRRCSREIKDLRASVARLQPKADAYDNLAIELLDKRIEELTVPASYK